MRRRRGYTLTGRPGNDVIQVITGNRPATFQPIHDQPACNDVTVSCLPSAAEMPLTTRHHRYFTATRNSTSTTTTSTTTITTTTATTTTTLCTTTTVFTQLSQRDRKSQSHYARLSASQSTALRLDEHTETSMTMPPIPATEMTTEPFLCPRFSTFRSVPPALSVSCNIDSDCAVRSPTFSLSTTFQEDTRIGMQSTDEPISTKPASQRRKSRRPVPASTVLTELPKATSSRTITANRTVSNSQTNHSDLLSCYVVNARSLKKVNALQLLETEMSSCMCDVAAVTETWLSKTVDSNFIKIDGYTLYRSDRARRKGGGIALYVKELYQSNLLLTTNSHNGILAGHELMWLKITKKGQDYIVGLLYHPPKPIYDARDFVNRLFNDIEELSCQNPQAVFYITGDFNQLDINRQCSDAGLTQIVQTATRRRHTLDLFLTNREDIVVCTVVKSCLNTDHLALMVNCGTSCSPLSNCDLSQRRQFHFYDIRQCYVDRLARALHECDWSCVTGAAEIDNAYDIFLVNVHRLIQQTIPCRKVTLTKSTPPHITPLVKSLLRRRNKHRRNGRIEAADELSTKIGNLITEFRATHLQRLNNRDIRRLWATVKPSLGKAHKHVGLCDMYGDVFADLDQINQYFAGIATDPNYDLDQINSMKPIISDKNPQSGDTVHEYEVYKMLSAIKKTSPGVDGVPYWVYKHCAIELTPVLTHLINKIVNNGNPPSVWLKALVTPVPKKTPPTDFSHLRPISVTSIMSRVTERLIVRKYLLPALPSDQILDQYAYKPTGSTTSALIATIHHISRLLESSSYVRCIRIDYSKAFDTINHDILFQKLQQHTIPPNVLLWIINFFSRRTQAVSSCGQTSGWLPVSKSIL